MTRNPGAISPPKILSALGRYRRNLYFSSITTICALLFPPKYWYGFSWRFTSFMASVLRMIGVDSQSLPVRQAKWMDHLMAHFTRKKRPFPVRYKIEGAGLLKRWVQEQCGIVLYSAHIPLMQLAVRAVMESGVRVNAAVAEVPNPDEKLAVWGLAERLPIFHTGPAVLLKARTILDNHGILTLMVDYRFGDYSINIFKLARLTGSRVVSYLAELQNDGIVHVWITEPPHPFCENDEAIQANLEALEKERRRILRIK